MDENLRVALIQFLNQMGEAPDPKSIVEFYEGWDSACYNNPRGTYVAGERFDLLELCSFLLTYQVT